MISKPRAMKIVCVEDGSRFSVLSASGHQYEIRYSGSGDADPDYVALWECSCPAGAHGRGCKHLTAFLNSRLSEDDILAGDAVEITSDDRYLWHPAIDHNHAD